MSIDCAHVVEKTLDLRIVVKELAGMQDNLQQASQCIKCGKLIWDNIPTVYRSDLLGLP